MRRQQRWTLWSPTACTYVVKALEFINGFADSCEQVSSKYLDLTKKKLELTRLPREVALAEGRLWALGTPKSVLETVLDYW